MNFVRITFWPPPEGLRSTGTGTNVRWAFKEKQNCQWLRCTLRTSSSEQARDRIYCGYTVSKMAPKCDLLGWHFCVCVCACARVCMRVCFLSLSLQSILLRQPGWQVKQVLPQTSSTLFINHSSHFENLLPPENHLWNEPFFLFFRLGNWNGGINTLMVIDWHFETSEIKGSSSCW